MIHIHIMLNCTNVHSILYLQYLSVAHFGKLKKLLKHSLGEGMSLECKEKCGYVFRQTFPELYIF